MMTLGHLNVAFEAQPKMMEVTLDPATQQQFLSFSVLLQVSIPHLLQELLSFQHRPDGQLPKMGAAQHQIPSSEKVVRVHQAQGAEQALQVQPIRLAEKPRQAMQEIPGSEKLFQAVMHSDVTAAAEAIREGGPDVMSCLAGPRRHPVMHAALEAGGRMDMVSMLIQARCDVNTPAADGKTPLHMAISQHATLSPMVVRLLLSAQADMTLPDSGNVTPLDCVRVIAKQPASVSKPAVRQLLDEVSERPTLAVAVVENEQVLGARFADMENEKVVFYTELALGLYSLSQRRIVWKLNLTQLRVQSVVRGMAVNPELGTISIFLEVNDGQVVQNLVIVWPTGHPQQEEPLKLSVATGPADGECMPPAMFSSTTKAALTLLGRICNGKVLCWRFNAACSQVTTEYKITDQGGLIALSDNGQWLAVEERGPGATRQAGVWVFKGLKRRSCPRRILSIDRRPEHMAIISQHSDSSCLLAVAQETPPGGALAPIEVLAIDVDGSMSTAFRVRQEAPCRMLSFCYENPSCLLSGHTNGVVLVYNLPEGKLRFSHDDMSIRSACASMDGKLIVTTVQDCFRIFRTSEEAK
uniref:Uncharacterized protein n=1 Tax=Alexandrium monilatum TaxID=311494 RepID=A0A7S4UYU3_9DINO